MLKRARQNTGSWNGSSDLFPGAPAPRPPRPSVFHCPANLLPSCSRVPYPLPIRLSLLFPVPLPFSSVSVRPSSFAARPVSSFALSRFSLDASCPHPSNGHIYLSLSPRRSSVSLFFSRPPCPSPRHFGPRAAHHSVRPSVRPTLLLKPLSASLPSCSVSRYHGPAGSLYPLSLSRRLG